MHPFVSRVQVFKRMGFTLAREHYEAVANADPGAVERVLKLVRARMARFQEAAARGPRPAGASSSQPSSPAYAAAYEGAAAVAALPYAPAVAAATDSIAALRLGGPRDVPSKLAATGAAGGGRAGSPAFPTLDQALASTLAEKEQQLEELRDVNEVGPGSPGSRHGWVCAAKQGRAGGWGQGCSPRHTQEQGHAREGTVTLRFSEHS